MRNESMLDPQHIWQNQPTEPCKMSADRLRRKAQQRHARDRFEALMSIALGLTLCLAFARMSDTGDDFVPRLGAGLLSLWCVNFAYQAYKWIWPGRLAPDSTVTTSLQFYRSQLEKRRDLSRHVWRRTALPFCFLGLAMMVVPGVIQSLSSPRLLWNSVPFFVILIIWFVAFSHMKNRTRAKLQREIDELRAFESETHS
jgi:hypothetical protein